MQAQYDAIKDAELKSGKSKEEAERIAAATYNKHHPDDPVIPKKPDTGSVPDTPVKSAQEVCDFGSSAALRDWMISGKR
jgi:hypothetical protein